MFKLMSLRRSFFTSLSCFKAEAVPKNANIQGTYKIMSGYSLYVSENIAKLTGTQTLKFKELSEKWKNETQEIKELYSKKASIMNEENKEKFESLPQQEKDKLIEEAKTKREKKDKRKNKAIKREKENAIAKAIGMTKPPSAFGQFVKEYYQKNPNKVVGGKVSGEISAMWKNLSESEKEERVRKSKEEFAKWNEKKNEYIKSIENM
uniref:HMG box domain-containing protein n=1 Tax=Strongyloides papillosus TaxID=174720 RepID=A0A0N5BKE8_STREA